VHNVGSEPFHCPWWVRFEAPQAFRVLALERRVVSCATRSRRLKRPSLANFSVARNAKLSVAQRNKKSRHLFSPEAHPMFTARCSPRLARSPTTFANILQRRRKASVDGRPGATVHGFRSSTRDWAGNVSIFPREVVETALAHVIGDKAEQA
jgi:hypothetical protein